MILVTDVGYGIVTSYELASYKIILTCVRVTFALISICSTCLLGHTTVKKGEIVPRSVGSILDIETAIIRYIFFFFLQTSDGRILRASLLSRNFGFTIIIRTVWLSSIANINRDAT
jgi:hypothetical protein